MKRSFVPRLAPLALVLLAAACYGAAPPRPTRLDLPPLADDAQLVVHSETKTEIERVEKQASTCPAGHAEGSQQCTITRYTVAEPVTRTTTRASYGGTPVSYGQFKILTDAKYDAKLSTLADLSHRCRRANVPRYVGMALTLGGLIAMPLSGGNRGVLLGAYGAIAGGGVAYGFGYFAYGGRQCNEARALYHDLDMSDEATWDSVQGADYATEMATLADQFNATRRTASAMRMR